MEQDINFEIMSNNAILRRSCPICGFSHKDAQIPFWIFIDGSYALDICYNCAELHAPDLLNKVLADNDRFWVKFEAGQL